MLKQVVGRNGMSGVSLHIEPPSKGLDSAVCGGPVLSDLYHTKGVWVSDEARLNPCAEYPHKSR
jgi:hypothetical protein